MADRLPDDAHALHSPNPSLWSRRSVGFPAVLTPLIGREREVATLLDLVRRPGARLITITGPGGVGKTRLALAVARELAADFADGAVFIPLAGVADPALVLPSIARALDIRETSQRPLASAIAAAVGRRRLLLTLDTLEHLLPAAAQLARLLEACPRLVMLVTSRSPLRIEIEQRFMTPPLGLPGRDTTRAEDLAAYGAVALFVERARAVRHDFLLTEEQAQATAEICRRLDGLPLAIELAAAWTRVLPPAALLARLDHRLPLLHASGEEGPVRQRTMRDAIAWSYDLLPDDAARLFRHLAIFSGGFTLEAAEAIGTNDGETASRGVEESRNRGVAESGEPSAPSPITHHPAPSSSLSLQHPITPTPSFASPDTLDLLATLIDASLVQPASSLEAEPRYQMLETVREFALEQLAASGDLEQVAAAHAAIMRDFAERAEPVLLGPDERAWHDRLDADLDNLRAALSWSLEHDVEAAMRIGAALWAYWSWGLVAEGRRWLEAALGRTASVPARVRARAMAVDAALAILEGDIVTGAERSQAAVRLAQEAGDIVTQAHTHWLTASTWVYTDQVEKSASELDRALALYEQAATTTDRAWSAYALSHRADAAWLSDPRQGKVLHEEAVARARAAGSECVTLMTLSSFIMWLIDTGETDRAREMLREALAIGAGHHERWLAGFPLLSLAQIDAASGEGERAARLLGATIAVMTLAGIEIPTIYQARIAHTASLARERIGSAVFALAWEAGHDDPGAVIADALGHAGAGDRPGDPLAAAFSLSPRECEVFRLLADGRADKEIAAHLFVTRRTASKHVAAILRKLGVDSRTAAVALALRRGLLGPLPGRARSWRDAPGASGANGENSP